MLDTRQKVADLVLEHSECAEVFHKHRIDFCCGGQMSLESAAAKRQVDLDALVSELTEAIAARRRDDASDARELSTEQLVEHIVATHHAYLRSVLPYVRTLAAKVARVHGDRNPKLRDLDALVKTLADALIPHLDQEEAVVFPMLLAGDDRAKIENEIAAMIEEHREVGDLLARLREFSDDFTYPEWACGSYRALIAELGELERDIHVHVHLENNALAPRFA